MHDEIATDKNNPTVNAYGPIYAVSAGHGTLTVLDPVDNDTLRDHDSDARGSARKCQSRFPPPAMPSNFWGMEHLWGQENPSDPHNPMMDRKGRVWMHLEDPQRAAGVVPRRLEQQVRAVLPAEQQQPPGVRTTIRPPASSSSSTRASPRIICSSPTTPTRRCTSTSCSGRSSAGSTRASTTTPTMSRRRRAGARRSSTPMATARSRSRGTRPANPPTRAATPRSATTSTRVIPSPVDNSVWGASEELRRGYIVRLDRGNNPPETCITEVYQVPEPGIDPRGIDIDSNGIVVDGAGGEQSPGRASIAASAR